MTSLIPQATIDRLESKTMPDVFDTLLALQNGGVTIVLGRYSPAIHDYVAIAPQTVLLDYAARLAQVNASESATITNIGGTMTFLEPSNVQAGDVFTLEGDDGYIAGKIISVGPIELGLRDAVWELRSGGI